ncbi:MAG TPA: 2Fe-2S iron-sulfur cluster-binding protein, partial [Nitrospirota bacterium]|nr:2Fe-2S iron-sulfur cluster-binding protein [Nitrospirota bacterium]
MSATVSLAPGGSARADEGETLLTAARKAGSRVRSDCGGRGACGKCKIKVLSGKASPATRAEEAFLSADELSSGTRLACLAYPAGDVAVSVPEQYAGAPPLPGSAKPRTFRLDPPVRSYYAELAAPSPGDPTADAERLLAGLSGQHGLEGVKFSYPDLRG